VKTTGIRSRRLRTGIRTTQHAFEYTEQQAAACADHGTPGHAVQ
jgi:hypothetical protein